MTALTLAWSRDIPSGVMSIPRYSTVVTWKLNLLALQKRLAAFSHCRTSLANRMGSSRVTA